LNKTRKSKLHTFFKTTSLIIIFILNTFNYQLDPTTVYGINNKIKYFYNLHLLSTVYKSLKIIFFKKNSLLTNNLTKSLLYNIIRNIKIPFKNTCTKPRLNSPTNKLSNVYYSIPQQVFTLSLHKSKFKTILFLYINLLTVLYVNCPATYNIRNTYLYMPSNFNILTFINLFYFKIRNF
jgi:hypothetical protein